MRKTYDVYFEERDGSSNHKILEGDCLTDIVAYVEGLEKVKEIFEIKLRKQLRKFDRNAVVTPAETEVNFVKDKRAQALFFFGAPRTFLARRFCLNLPLY